MVLEALKIMESAFWACADWTNQLFTVTGGGSIVLAAFCIVVIVGVLFMPLRGGNILPSYSSVSDFVAQTTYRGKFGKNAKKPNYSKMGRFEKGNSKAKIDRNSKLRSM